MLSAFTYASPDRLPDVCALWLSAFPEDTAADVAAFWDALYAPHRCLLYEEDGRALSMAFLLPAVYQAGADSRPLWYVYAACTTPSRRGEGLFGRVLAAIADEAAAAGATPFLRPASPSLARYYERFGYVPWFGASEAHGVADRTAALPLQTAVDYAAARRRLLCAGGNAWVDWADDVTAYAVSLAVQTGGGAVETADGCALCERAGNDLLIRELLCPPAEQAAWCAALLRRFGGTRYCLRRPAEAGETPQTLGWLCGHVPTAGSPYMGLTLE